MLRGTILLDVRFTRVTGDQRFRVMIFALCKVEVA